MSESRCRLEAGSGVEGWVSEVAEPLDSRRVLEREVVEALALCSLSSSMSNFRFVVASAGSCKGDGEDAMPNDWYYLCVRVVVDEVSKRYRDAPCPFVYISGESRWQGC